ncbi:hypothetical protein GCM10010236_78380 [Streptomyces eurythermus]|nr:hypothetical protein GCM10010236_78380 [Streptomyces eurythermus]
MELLGGEAGASGGGRKVDAEVVRGHFHNRWPADGRSPSGPYAAAPGAATAGGRRRGPPRRRRGCYTGRWRIEGGLLLTAVAVRGRGSGGGGERARVAVEGEDAAAVTAGAPARAPGAVR